MTATASTPPLGLGYSTCPNDTFMFDAMVHGRVDTHGLTFTPWLADIAELNARARAETPLQPLDITKISVAQLGHITRRYACLSAGAALGRGCGPLVLRRGDDVTRPDLASLAGGRIAIPGPQTTANLLLSIFAPPQLQRVVLRFDEIMPALQRGEVDAGLVIHESRFTYRDHGLAQVADLGDVWEQTTGLPLPLGVIVAHRRLAPGTIADIERTLSASVRHAFAHPTDSAAYVREHAQEMDPQVCRQHIALYVGDYSAELGDEGRAAIDELLARGRACGALSGEAPSPWRHAPG